ncbi:MAG: GAF domain-containing SpoIIE family protein phosphatase [Acidobacteriota bacterium]
MSRINLKNLLGGKKEAGAVVAALLTSMDDAVRIVDVDGDLILGKSGEHQSLKLPVPIDGTVMGYVIADDNQKDRKAAEAVATLVTHLGAREAEKKTLGSEILHLYREINLIYKFSESLAARLEVSAVAEMSLNQARQLIASSSGAVMIFDEPTRRLNSVAAFGSPLFGAYGVLVGEGLLGAIAERGNGEIVNDVARDPRYVEEENSISSLICAPLKVNERLRGVLVLASSEPAHYTAGDLKLFSTLALQTATAIENAALYEQMVEAAQLRERLLALHKELEVASVIQQSIVPRKFPPFPERSDFEILAEMIPAKEVGGDFFDFFLIDEARLGFAIGDVSGKGIPAALFMAVSRTLLKATALRGLSPEDCIEHVNRVLTLDSASHMFVTCFYGILDTSTGVVSYCNAGHNPPYVLRRDGRVEMTEMTGGLVLGMRAKTTYRAKQIELGSGDGVFLYTDGITEAMDVERNEYSESRLEECLSGLKGSGMDEIIRSVLVDVRKFTGEAAQTDDMTLLLLRRSG